MLYYTADMETTKRRGRPPTGVAPTRSMRIPDDLWEAARERAWSRRETVTAVVVRALQRYIKQGERKQP